jgi:hypothetical protein
VHDGTYTARPDDPHATRVDALRGLAPAAVARWRLRWDKIGEAVAGAFGIESHSGTGPFDTPWVRSIGVLRANDAVFGALLLVAKTDVDALGWVRHLVRGESRVFILPFHDPLCADLAAAHGHRYLALDRDVQFVFSKGLWGVEARIGGSKATANAAAWSKAELEKVEIVGDFNLVRFADGLEISFHRRARCRAYLAFLMDRCVRRNEFVFDHQTIVTDYNETKPLRPIKSERLDHDLFKQVKGFDRLFETVDRAKQRFRLLIRRR